MASYNGITKDTRSGAILSKLIILFLAIFSLYFIFLNLIFSIRNNVLIYGLIIIPAFIVVFLVSYKLNIPPLAFALAIFVLALLSKGLLVSIVDTIPVSDFNTFYQSAIKLVKGDKSFGHTQYFYTWAYQTGPVIYYAAIMKIFGMSLLPLKLVNVFFMAGSNVLIYLVAKKISTDYAARIVSLLYLGYPAPYFLASVLTNQHFAAFMFLLAIYVLLNTSMHYAVKAILAGILICFGNAARPLGIIIIVSVLVWSIIEAIKNKKVVPITTAIVLLISYFLLNFGLSAAVRHADINPEGLKNNFPLWKFVIGLNSSSNGQFSYADQNEIFYIEDPVERDAVAKQTIKKRMSVGPRKLITLINIKQTIMWANFDTMRWAFYKQIDQKLVIPDYLKRYEHSILKTEKIYYLIIFLLVFLGLGGLLWKKNINSGITFLSVLLLCYFGVHILIEIQVRYRYFAVMLLFILAAKGSELVFSGFHTYRRKYSLKDI